MRFFLYISFMLIFGFAASCQAPIKVGVIIGPPFAMKSEGTYSGFAIDIWNEIALGMKRPYVFVSTPYTDFDKPFQDLAAGKIDVLVGPISVTADRSLKGDFSLPYFIDKLIAVTPTSYLHNALRLLKLFTISVGGILIVFFALFALYLSLLWYYERQYTSKVSKKYKEGVFYLFWVHILSGHHEEVPRSKQGRLLILFQKTTFYIILIILNATMISFLTISLSQYSSPVQSLTDLEKIKVGATKSSKSIKTAKSMGIPALPYDSIEDGFKAIEKGQIQAFLTDLSLADYYLSEYGFNNLGISHYTLKYDLYVFMTQKNSPLLRDINEQMINIRSKGLPEKICRGYLIKGAQNCDL